MGWWFGRIMTFEVVADSEVPNLGAILGDASGEIIACDEVQPVMGYAGYGQSMRAAVEPLIDAYAIDLFDDGDRLVSPGDVAIASISDRELGSSADNQKVSIIQREQTAARTLPAALRIGYYDATLDYQAGEARATAGDGGVEERRELPAVVGAGEAKSLVQHILAREWARRDTLTLHLPPGRLDLTPGTILDVGLSPRLWSVEQCTIDGFVVVAQLKPAWRPQASVSAESGRIVKAEDIAAANLALALFDIPDLVGSSSTTPTLMLAASSASPGWKSCGVEIVAGEQGFPSQTAVRKSVLGSALSILSAGSAHLIDESDALEVQLIDPDQWLVSCDDDALVNGSNLAVLGSELLQFGSAEPLGEGRFRLTRLLRGRGGTEWAMTTHAADEPFALIERDALRAISLPSWSTGGSAAASARNLNGVTSLSAPVVVRGESLRPLSPINVGSAADADGLALTWTRRSRDGWAWIDGVDAPIGETFERYRVTLTGAAGVIETEVGAPALHLSVDEIAALGTGIVSVEVSQVGDLGASRAAEHSFII